MFKGRRCTKGELAIEDEFTQLMKRRRMPCFQIHLRWPIRNDAEIGPADHCQNIELIM
jgi:hypothetical protein